MFIMVPYSDNKSLFKLRETYPLPAADRPPAQKAKISQHYAAQ